MSEQVTALQSADAIDLSAEQAGVMARTFATLYGAGATVVLITLALPHPADRTTWPIIVAVVLAYAVAALMLIRRERIPHPAFHALPPLGTILVSVVVLAAGASSLSAYAMMYFFVVLSAFYFFSRWVAFANMVGVALAYGAVLISVDSARTPQIKWVMAVAALSVSGALIFKLRSRLDALIARLRGHVARADRLAQLQDQALRGADPAQLMQTTVEMVGQALGAESVGVLELLADENLLLLRWGTGWKEGWVGNSTMPLSDENLAGYTLSAGRPVITGGFDGESRFARTALGRAHDGRSAVTVTIPTRDGSFGVLGALSPRPNAFGAEDASFLQAVAGTLATAIQRRRDDDELRQRAYYDQLTGQPNRTQFLERLEEALERARTEASALAVLFLDLDNFKVVNDSLGHEAGDELLRGIGPRLRRALVLTDTVARFGSDSFVVLCEGVRSEEQAQTMARAILASLAEPFRLRDAPHRVSASVGVAFSEGRDITAQELMRNADTAMYAAKSRGHGHLELFDDRMRQRAITRMRLENALAGALERREFSLVYQPIVSLETGAVERVEALLRWEAADWGPVSPVDFIPIAEETGMIVPIGRWVLHQAVADVACWRDQFQIPLTVNVNLSPKQVGHPELRGDIAAALTTHRLAPEALALEITEGVLLEDSQTTLSQLDGLRELGVQLVLDDFGTGYSSLSYLRRLPISALKIDRSFVSVLQVGGEEAAIVGAMATMGAALGLAVVAEGTETEEQLDRVRELGCTSAQGYLIARPMPAAELDDFLACNGAPSISVLSPGC